MLNRREATNALKRLIYTDRVANYQAKIEDEIQAVADALSLLANIVMAWNTSKMQAIFDRCEFSFKLSPLFLKDVITERLGLPVHSVQKVAI